MLLIGLLFLIVLSSNNYNSIKELKNIIHIGILILSYMLIILNNSISIWEPTSSSILINNGILIFNDTFLITNYNILIKNLIIILSIIYLIILINYTKIYNNFKYIKEFIILIIFNILGIWLFIDSINSIIIFISIELQSYVLYLITSTLYKNEYSIGLYSSKNGLIYFLLGSLASIILLFGLTLLYYESGLINLIDLNIYLNSLLNINTNTNVINTEGYININWNYYIGFIFIIIGLSFKIGLAPLHNWLINIYTNVPTITTLWISIIPKISILTFILTLNLIFSNLFNIIQLSIYFNIIIILSMIIGALGGLPQFNIKRILAYSGIVNSSYMLFGIISNNQYSIISYIFYILQYSITHFTIFMALLFIIINYNKFLIYNRYNSSSNNSIKGDISNITHNLYLNDLIGFLQYNKTLSIIIIITLTSFIGLPPLLGFYGKYYILITGLLSGYWFTSLILIIVSMITAYYYGYIIKVLFSITTYTKNNYYNHIYINNTNYIYSYILSTLSLIILFLLLFLDIYQNGIIIINYLS